MNCEICNQEMEHLESVGMICTSCDIEFAAEEDKKPIKEVHVAIEFFKGILCDVVVFKDDPDPFHNYEYCEEEGTGVRVFHTEIIQHNLKENSNG